VIPSESNHERVYRGLLRLYPAGFRARFADEMVQLFRDQVRDARTDGAPAGIARAWLRTLADLAVTATSERARRDRTVAHSLAVAPSTSSRLLGLVGILGGLLLLVVFIVDITPELNVVRLVLFNAGAIAIVIAVHRRQAPAGPTVALLSAGAAVVANAWSLAMILLAIGRPQPPLGDPDFRLVGFFAGAAMWLTDAAFGLVTLRLGAVTRLGALALAVGSVLAFSGMDRLELTSAANPTIFGPLSLLGFALNGIGWILLGIDVATRRRAAPAVQPAQPEAGPATR
jgi:hypothetical protein